MYWVTKLMVFVLVFCCLITARELGDFIFSFINNTKYHPSKFRLVTLGLAISYILTIIFTGFRLV